MTPARLLALFEGFREDLKGLTARVRDFERGLADAAAVAVGKVPRPLDGPQGDPGPVGNPGPPGPRGPAGDTGPAGAPGANAVNGRDGDTGPDGQDGPRGQIGPAGPRGPGGPTGPAGPKGDPGPAGPGGPKGPAGKGVTAARVDKGHLLITVDGREKDVGRVTPAPSAFGGGGGGLAAGLAAGLVFVDMALDNVSSSPYDASEPSTLIVDATSGPIVINLPDAAEALETRFEVKKTDGTVNSVTLTASAGDLIDGAATFDLEAQHEAVTIRSDGNEWWTL